MLGVLCGLQLTAGEQPDEKHIRTAMRLLGHQLLLSAGDSTSRVLPVEKEGNSYRIRFASDFGFYPEELVKLMDSVNLHTNFARHYLVEVVNCDSGNVVYSYEVGGAEDIIPCKGRKQDVGCYTVVLNILDAHGPVTSAPVTGPNSKTAAVRTNAFIPLAVLTVLLLIISVLWVYFRKSEGPAEIQANLIPLGAYRYDATNMELQLKDERMELTGKENELLLLLYQSANTTLERETILNKVWGDEGVYIGRTLDVFISKLRKKLEQDPSLKIVNVRGVGYKLVVNG